MILERKGLQACVEISAQAQQGFEAYLNEKVAARNIDQTSQ